MQLLLLLLLLPLACPAPQFSRLLEAAQSASQYVPGAVEEARQFAVEAQQWLPGAVEVGVEVGSPVLDTARQFGPPALASAQEYGPSLVDSAIGLAQQLFPTQNPSTQRTINSVERTDENLRERPFTRGST